jgi:ABC-type transport system substrate-binding protein
MFLSLLEDDAFTGEMIGILAARWDGSEDGLEYTFSMRDALEPGLK